jgi:hypothetical protein
MNVKQIECKGCGSIFELRSVKVPMRDQDKIDCEVCGKVLHRWSQGKVWEAKLIERREPSKP